MIIQRPGYAAICAICLLGLLFFLQYTTNGIKEKERVFEKELYLPSGQVLRVVALEFDAVVADLLWLKAVQFMGNAGKTTEIIEHVLDYNMFYNLMDRITDLDPQFDIAYKSGAITLSVLADYPDLSIQLLEKGMQHNPDDWEIPFYIGFNYMYHKNDHGKAAVYMEKASRLEGHPPYLPLLTSRLYSQAGNRETAILFLKGIYLSTKDEATRAKIAEKIAEMERGEELKPVAPMQ